MPLLLLASLFSLFAHRTWAQAGASGLKARRPEDRAVVLDAVARAGDNPVGALTWLIDGVPAPASSLQPTSGGPVQLVLLLDALNCSPPEFTRGVDAVSAFLAQDSGHLPQPTTVLVLSGPAPRQASSAVTPVAARAASLHRIPASQDGLRLRELLRHAVAGLAVAPGTVMDRVGLSLDALGTLAGVEVGEPGPKLVLWIGPGWPLLPGRVHESDAAGQHVYDSVVALSGLLLRARILLYSLDPAGISTGSDAGFNEGFLLAARPGSISSAGHAPALPDNASDGDYREFVRFPRTAQESSPNDLALQVLAVQSGGLVIQHENRLEIAVTRCAVDAGRIRSVQYLPPPGQGSLQFHTVEARLAGDSVPLRARAGFYSR